MKKPEEFPLTVKRGSVSAKIYRTPTSTGYDSFTLVYWQDKTRKREVFGDLAEAKKRGGEVVGALAKGEIGAANITAQDAAAFLRAIALLLPTGVSLESACREYVEAFKVLGGVSILQAAREYAKRHSGEVTSKTVQQVVDEFMAAKRGGRATRIRGSGRIVSGRYLDDLERKLKALAGRFHCLIGAVSGHDINDFIHGLDVEGRTKNNYRQAINILFEFARKEKYLPRDHAVMDEVEEAAEADFEIEIFTPDEVGKLLKHAPDNLLPVLAIGAFAGLRTSEIERLDWQDVKFDAGCVVVQKGKVRTKRGRARRIVPMLPNLKAWLKKVAKESGPVWPHSSPYLFELQSRVAEDAKVPWKHNALRHSFISYRVAMVKNVDQVALEAGNSPEMIFEHYRELVTAEAAKGWFSVVPKAARFKVRSTKAGNRQKPKTEPENVTVMPDALAA
jgi:integrase